MSETKTKIIDGETFTISQPYSAGHTLTEAEAKALNQVRSENIGNNLRNAIKEAKEKGDTSGLAQLVADYDRDYTFALGGSGPSTRKLDPIERECRAIANEHIKADLAKKGRKISQVPEGLSEDEWKEKLEATREAIMAREAVIKLAKKRVKEKQGLLDEASEGFDL